MMISYVNLPEVVLEVIFKHLKNEPETLASCTRVSNVWDNVLMIKKQHFMFHLILPVLVNHNHLSYQDVMQCRLVSRYWRRAVDRLNEQVTPAWNPHIEHGFDAVTRSIIRGLPFSGCSSVSSASNFDQYRRFRKNEENYTNNPLPTRCLSFHASIERGPTLGFNYIAANLSLWLNTNFHQMLEACGTHVSHLLYSYVFDHYLCESPDQYDHHKGISRLIHMGLSPKYLLQLLYLMPNLTSLVLSIENTSISTRNTFLDIPSRPILSNFVSLTLRFRPTSPAVTHFLFTSYGKQLEYLECVDEDLIMLLQANIDDTTFQFPKLKRMKLVASREITSNLLFNSNSDYCMHKLNSTITADSLEYMSLELMDLGSDLRNFSNLFSRVKPFSKSLVEMHVQVIESTNPVRNYWTTAPFTNFVDDVLFPRLTTFHINAGSSNLSRPSMLLWGLLLRYMPALQTLRIFGENGRVRSFKEDAEQLGVTRSSISPPSIQRLSGLGETRSCDETRREEDVCNTHNYEFELKSCPVVSDRSHAVFDGKECIVESAALALERCSIQVKHLELLLLQLPHQQQPLDLSTNSELS